MFTVLHRHTDGAERLYEAESVIRLRREGEDACIPPQGDVCLNGVKTSDTPGDTVRIEARGAACASSFEPQVFVMNRYGATVAIYHL